MLSILLCASSVSVSTQSVGRSVGRTPLFLFLWEKLLLRASIPFHSLLSPPAPIRAAVIFHVFLRHFSPRNYPPAPKAVI